MAKDSVTVVVGIVSLALIIIQWIIQVLPYEYELLSVYHSSTYLLNSTSGFLMFFGVILLIPSFILDAVFIASTKGSTSGKVGFGLGVGGWAIIVLGNVAVYLAPSHLIITTYIPLLSTTLTICLIIFGILLFSRVYKIKPRTDQDLPSTFTTTRPEGASQSKASSSDDLVGPPCPDCNKATKYMAKYDRYYCPDCKKYLPP
ncbi:MAG: hypothetical protein LUQ65_02480 [Candidatus Helarchaeota archaeon]|nr:hypothetical protein [Candidatus Helarchaeota archaeon]